MKKLFKLLKLSRLEKALLIQAYGLLTLVRLGLFILPFQKLQTLLASINQLKRSTYDSRQVITRDIVIAVNRGSRLCPGTVKCLARALTTSTLMSMYGLASQLNIGVAMTQSQQIEAHAWIEAEGKIVIGHLPDLSRYVPMQSLKGDISL